VNEARYCKACGIKVRGKREKCPKCSGPLTAPPVKVRPPTARERRAAVIAVVAVVGLIGLGVLWPRPAPPPDLAVPAPNQPPAVRAAQGRSPSSASEADDPFEVPFITPKHAGGVAYGAGELDRAIGEYEQALKDNPDDAESLSNLGQVLVKQGRAPEAIPLFERAIALLPSRWAYHFNLARALGETGDWERSVTEYQVAQRLFPDDFATEFNLARALHKAGREEEAVQGYLRAIDLAPEDASFRMSLGISYERLKRPADAVKAYEEYLRLAPDAPDAARVKERIGVLTKGAQAATEAKAAPPAPPVRVP
jgi:tetratricopeptide (TPR) repeat protein